MSKHRSTKRSPSTAFDIAIGNHDKQEIIELAERVGFKGIGTKYKTFVHVDDRPNKARWYLWLSRLQGVVDLAIQGGGESEEDGL